MTHVSWILVGLIVLVIPGDVLAATTFNVDVSLTPSHAVPSTLFGQMFEDINSGDGGLYGECMFSPIVYSLLHLLTFSSAAESRISASDTEYALMNARLIERNADERTDTTAALDPWAAIGEAQLTVIADPKPVSSALPNSLQVTVPAGTSGSVGFSNSGFWGIKVESSWTYNASFYFRFPSASTFTGKLNVALQTTSGRVLASNSISVRGSQTGWTHVSLSLRPSTTAPNTDNVFAVTIEPTRGDTETAINFAMFSLFPPTFKNRPNGMRIDIAETLAEMGPAFFRFPGGNNVGQTTATRWQWNATVGSLLDRPGRVGDWGYVNTDGLGLLEYLNFFEDVGMEPIMAVWSGYSLGGTSLPENELAPYIQQAADQINFVIGEPGTSPPASLRASLGHPEPFALRFVEVGNEDFFAADTYPYRWRDFAGNLSALFPNITFIATTDAFSPIISPDPQAYDVHVYQTPGWFIQNAFYYDSFERNSTKYFEGEYAAISTNASNIFGTPDQGRLLFPDMQSASGEATFMTGLERNSDIVFAASYAPLLQHVNDSQWTPDLVSFDAGNVYRSTSFFVQKVHSSIAEKLKSPKTYQWLQLFSLNKGDEYLPTTLPDPAGTVFWSAVRNTTSQEVILKVANAGADEAAVVFQLPFTSVAESGTLQQLHGDPTASNTPEQPNSVAPVTSKIATGKVLNFTAPAFSVSVISVQVK
ncbi:hypothetical protein NM688_g1033 [Phlebia brevispora]|uniref:Uncharacterized protein n=1 Tax=Phlebia brevispora TaxID=194682 RepID=A0ACC1TCF9_9APHY|nr:hypothetical protein NM688_g1033 [Phlebia brevispora]